MLSITTYFASSHSLKFLCSDVVARRFAFIFCFSDVFPSCCCDFGCELCNQNADRIPWQARSMAKTITTDSKDENKMQTSQKIDETEANRDVMVKFGFVLTVKRGHHEAMWQYSEEKDEKGRPLFRGSLSAPKLSKKCLKQRERISFETAGQSRPGKAVPRVRGRSRSFEHSLKANGDCSLCKSSRCMQCDRQLHNCRG